MKKAKKIKSMTLKQQVSTMETRIEWLATNNLNLNRKIEELEKDKHWLKQLVQEMSNTMNAGAREGSFPRRNS